MVQIKHILCPIDFSDHSRHALDHAVALARWYRASIVVMYVHRLAVPTFAVGPFITPQAFQPIGLTDVERAHLLQGIGDFVAKDRAAGAAIELLLEEDLNVADAIVARAQTLAVDLIVIGTHGRSGFDRWVLGSVAEKVLRAALSPVLIVPPRAADAVPLSPTSIRRIICPLDFSPSSTRALAFAASVAAQAQAHLTVAHVVELLHEVQEMPVEGFDTYRKARFEGAKRAMAQAVSSEAGGTHKIDERLVAGKPYREILRLAAEQQADLIVMGVRGRGALDRMFFGSTTQHVVRQAACPVLTVREG